MDMLETAVYAAAKALPSADTDYIEPETGLLFCGRCHTSKQYRVTILGSSRIVPVMCKCRKAEWEAEQAEMARHERETARNELRKICFADTDIGSECATFASDDRRDGKVSDAMRRYAQQWEEMRKVNMGLLLYGPVGTGKSFYAACVANELLSRDQPVPVIMTSLGRIINAIQGMYDGKQEYIDRLAHYPLLILDDVGTERDTGFAWEQIYNVIDARYRAGKPLIVTTNRPIEEIKQPQTLEQQRIYSRLLELCQPVKIGGSDRRRDAVKQKYAERQALLGL